MKGNYKAKFHKISNEEKNCWINKYCDQPGLLKRIVYELKDKSYSEISKSHEKMDLKKIGLDKYGMFIAVFCHNNRDCSPQKLLNAYLTLCV
jgi:hypothetical protein